ncbi:minor capsid protein [Cytobacillus kochii]|uniref:minor capsid protein n=1 Tax=Cytobacillus kochii TaxID=859143 RepID=UPI001CD810EE|nr:minor capsid protein [Cytobacillus kochii]MCA1025778.1 minor capsid protein [Cytobacillus kochii]
MLLDKKVYKNEAQYEKKLARVYQSQISEMSKSVEAFIFKYAKDNKLSYKGAEQALTGVDLDDYNERIKGLSMKYKQTGDEKALEDLELIGKQRSITRLGGLINELTVMLGLLSVDTQMSMDELLGETYQEAYYQTAFNIVQGVGMALPVARVNKDALDTILKYPFSGKHYSDRIWTNKSKMIEALREELIRGAVQGTEVRKLAKNIRSKLDVSKFNAMRLMRTETAFVVGEGTAKGYEQMGVQKYQILATLDSKTSKVCQHQDGKVYLLSERVQGRNASPFHPMCRSTEVPYIEANKDGGSRLARGSDGKNYKVPRNITYKEWEKKYVK